MTNEENKIVIDNINNYLQKTANVYANKLIFGFINGCCDCCEAKLLYLYKRTLQTELFEYMPYLQYQDTTGPLYPTFPYFQFVFYKKQTLNNYLTADQYNSIYISIQQITKKY
jgi:hypothetical protein